MADTHIINGKGTSIGHSVHYTDQSGDKHAAIIRRLIPPEQTSTGTHHADLHVFPKDNMSDIPMQNIQHSVSGLPNTWSHIS